MITIPIAQIDVSVNEDEIKEQITQRIEEMIRDSLLMIDVDTLAKKLCMSKRFLEEEILQDVRMKAIERKKSRKRFYFYDEVIPVVKEIVYDKF
ncbi:hypothetical protein [Gracilibacillus massiliensis]|uniref:hypothetical protein n=1 Tax=Gracilibacillus massiliensis TaxID=1564956 RepID=UPI000A95BAC8|nr:hypothetical protein [Gracilibacillus massiliensis]